MSYALDTTGLSVANLITGETHSLTPAALSNFGYIFLNKGPFFGENLSVTYTPSGGSSTTLVLGVDYQPIFTIPGIGTNVTTQIWGALEFFNLQLNGSISLTYQTLGGNWTFNTTQISQYLNANAFNASTEVINLVPSPVLYLPNNPSVAWPINSVNSLVIAQAQVSSISLGVEFDAIGTVIGVTSATEVVQSTPTKLKATVVGTGTFAVQNTASIPTGNNVIGLVKQTSNFGTLDSGTIASGGAPRQLFSGITPVNGFEICNTHLTEVLYFTEAGTVSVGGAVSVPILPAAKYVSPLGYKPTGAISVTAATAGHGYVARSF